MADITRPSMAAGVLPAALLLLAPFEPRRPVLVLGPMALTLLEAASAAGVLALLAQGRSRLGAVLRSAPVRWAWAFALAHLLSAALAAESHALAFKFSLRMTALALAATAIATCPEASLSRSLRALALAGLLVSGLALGEGAGLRALDPFLGLFREMPFNVGGVRRASAGSEYPNLAAAFLMYALVAVGGLGAMSGHPWRWVAVAVPLTCGLLLTFSRTGLLGAAAGLVVMTAVLRRSRQVSSPFAALLILGLGTGVFAAGQEAFVLRLSSEGVASWYGAAYEPARTELGLRPGEATRMEVRVTNRGRLVWTRQGMFHLSYHWYDTDRGELRDGGRTVLPRDVGPGESVVLEAEVRAPEREGAYLLLWDMVQEHTSWFSGQGVAPGVGRVLVSRGGTTPPPPLATPSAAAGLAWRPGRRALWPLAFRMWQAHPISGVGSDNFRWLYGRWAGRPLSDHRVFANNAYLEMAATTGVLGLVALGGLLVSSAVSARRALEGPGHAALPATLLALTVAWAVHGLADYTLAFTGHYLVFAFVVGASAAVGRQEIRP